MSMRIQPRPRAPTPPHKFRPWAVSAITWLLLVELAGLLVLAIVNRERLAGLGFVALAVLALAALVGFMRLRRGGWVNAVLVQGGDLALALLLYFQSQPAYSYAMMVYGILMVLYLHQADVQAAFRLAPGSEPGPP